MRPAALVLALAVFTVAGCLLPARPFSIELPGDIVVDDLPVTLEDKTGLVQAIGLALPGQFNLVEGVGPGDNASMLVVSWLGGSCDVRTHLTFDRRDGGYVIEATTEGTSPCRSSGHLRTVTLLMAEPVDPTLVTLEVRGRSD
jgi:hypothetical protein